MLVSRTVIVCTLFSRGNWGWKQRSR